MTDTLATNNTVPIQEVPMHEVRTRAELQDALRMLFEDDMPGFVIRAAGLDTGEIDHEAVRGTIMKILDESDFASGDTEKYGVMEHYGDHITQMLLSNEPVDESFPAIKRKAHQMGKGKFHLDPQVEDSEKVVDVHTTKKGAGKVTIAHPESAKAKSFKPKTITQAAAAGRVDPEDFSPDFNVADLNEGDHTVLRPGVDFHRFDTTIEPRIVNISLLRPELETDQDQDVA